ncbi:hypothetical protein BM221_005112 [Beauveria bassiana]|uniref:Uncharacterized protein n=1 Tax=Beauveria bassiana TaxID=176275 RepID=A0A2N6NMN6_BEABA|nr:hypothetical protein BM221_005112 [Beauveria bassiana]
MSTVLNITNKPVDSETHEDDEIEPMYKEFRSSEENAPIQRRRLHRILSSKKRFFKRHGRNIAFASVALILIALSISQLCLLVRNKQPHIRHSGESNASRQPIGVRVLDCGKTVTEAKAKGCTWDELSKAWLPRECPRYGIEDYRMQGMLSNPHQNASSWPYYWDQGGTSGLNLDHVAANEERDMTEQVWTTSRQHLTHCASTLKRTIWSYEKGHGHYDAVSQLSHAHHCINTLLKGAILAEGEAVDHITTLTRVHVGHCSFIEWD